MTDNIGYMLQTNHCLSSKHCSNGGRVVKIATNIDILVKDKTQSKMEVQLNF